MSFRVANNNDSNHNGVVVVDPLGGEELVPKAKQRGAWQEEDVEAPNNHRINSNHRNNSSATTIPTIAEQPSAFVVVEEDTCEDEDINHSSHSRRTERGTRHGAGGGLFPAMQQRLRLQRRRNSRDCGGEEEENNTHTSKRSASDSFGQDMLVAQRETKVVIFLRLAVLCLLILTTTLVSAGVYRYTKKEQEDKFETEYRHYARQIVETFHSAVERRLGAINSMATAITSHAQATNQTFPFVTIPDFAVRGADLRIQADAHVVHYMPLVTEENREKWENYSMSHRFQINEAYDMDAALREMQDAQFGLVEKDDGDGETTEQDNLDRLLAESSSGQSEPQEPTMLQDGSMFHPKIWSAGGPATPRGDEVEGNGPYLPLWQRSPISPGRQVLLNWNFAGTFALFGVLPKLLETKQAIMNKLIHVQAPEGKKNLEANLAISQFRQNIKEFANNPFTFMAYPVFDSFDINTREIGGVLVSNIYWRLFFERILPPSARGIVCVLENSYNQTMSFSVDGSTARFLGEGDAHDPRYNHLEESSSINQYVQNNAGPETRSYLTVPLNEKFGQYVLRIYPSAETEDSFSSNDPFVYTSVVVAVFFFTSLVFVTFALVVERRQAIVMTTAIKNARKAANTERELNEFLSHEVRNPLAAAMSACAFVVSAINGDPSLSPSAAAAQQQSLNNDALKKSLMDDVQVIDTSLNFINDFLRSMLDMHRAAVDRVEFKMAPANVMVDVLEPVCNMLYQRNITFIVTRECPDNVVIMTDVLRLKQIVLNLGVNSAKYVENGFIRFRTEVINGLVVLYVEDSGPGIPLEKRNNLFERYENRLDELSQGTGVGLGLAKSLINSLDGDIWLDETYNSGLEGWPGARFVIELNAPPLPVEPVPIPVKPKSSDETTEATSVEEPPPGPVLPEDLSALVVDDDNILRKLVSRAVKRVAPTWTIEQAPDGETALRFVDEGKNYDIIFMDQYMPSTTKTLLGTETIEALRARGVKSRICGLSANDLEAAFLESGADCFRVKPIPGDKKELENWLIRTLG